MLNNKRVDRRENEKKIQWVNREEINTFYSSVQAYFFFFCINLFYFLCIHTTFALCFLFLNLGNSFFFF